MKFTIISLNDDRMEYKARIRERVGFDEIHLSAVDGRVIDVPAACEERGLDSSKIWENAKQGEIGVWFSNFDRWELAGSMEEPLIVFEDDAIPDENFDNKIAELVSELPSEWDFAALWVPDNQRVDYLYDVAYNECGDPIHRGWRTPKTSMYRIPLAKAASLVYQGYGMVSLVYSPQGGRKLVELARSRGMETPVDCWIYQEAHKGNLNGFAPLPERADIVHYDWAAASHVQQTERI